MWKPRKCHELTRDQLYDLIWSEPAYKVAERFVRTSDTPYGPSKAVLEAAMVAWTEDLANRRHGQRTARGGTDTPMVPSVADRAIPPLPRQASRRDWRCDRGLRQRRRGRYCEWCAVPIPMTRGERASC